MGSTGMTRPPSNESFSTVSCGLHPTTTWLRAAHQHVFDVSRSLHSVRFLPLGVFVFLGIL